MYGDKWDAAIPAFKVLALSIPTTLILNPVGPVYLAANASKQMFWVGIVNTAMDIIGFTVGAYLEELLKLLLGAGQDLVY